MQVLHSGRVDVSHYRSLVKDGFFDGSSFVGSGAQAVVELTRRPGVVIKRSRRFEHGSSTHLSRADRNFAHIILEVRILTSSYLRSFGFLVKVMGVCFEDSMADPDQFGVGQFHLLLEYSELGDLAAFLRRNGQRLDTEVKIDLAYQVTRALSILHSEFICHGDLKIENVLVFDGRNGDYVAKLADFGGSVVPYDNGFLAGWEEDVYYPPGTPLLNAPEVRNRSLNTTVVDFAAVIRAEVFSFGLLLWEILKNGRSYFNMAWLDAAGASEMNSSMEEQMAFLSTLSCNGLLMRAEEFLTVQNLDDQLHEHILRVFHASLQDDPLQRQPMLKIWEVFLPPSGKMRSGSVVTSTTIQC